VEKKAEGGRHVPKKSQLEKKKKMYFFLPVFLLASLLPGAQSSPPPCVPSPVSAALAATRGPAIANVHAADVCCQMSSGVISCATSDPDNDGVVIDLDLGSLTVAHAAGAPPSAGAPASATTTAATTTTTSSLSSLSSSSSEFRTRIVLDKPSYVTDFDDPAAKLTGKVWFKEFKVGDKRARIVTSSTIIDGVKERRAAALLGLEPLLAGPEKCTKVCGRTAHGYPPCMSLRLCITRLQMPNTYYVSAKVDETVYAATIMGLSSLLGPFLVDTHISGVLVSLQAMIILAVNPELKRFVVTAQNIRAYHGGVPYIVDPITFDDPGGWEGEDDRQASIH
jgi:hypothetical protein